VDPLPEVPASVQPVALPATVVTFPASETPSPEPVAVAPEPAAEVKAPPAPKKVTRRSATKPPAPKPKPKPPTKVNEFTCVMENYALDGCDEFRTPPEEKPLTVAEATPVRPSGLSSYTISKTMKRANSTVQACGDRYGVGHVKVRVKVTPDGQVSSVKVLQSPTAGLGKCVVEAVNKLSFPATEDGASFTYLFPIR
jgi:TonB family protein